MELSVVYDQGKFTGFQVNILKNEKLTRFKYELPSNYLLLLKHRRDPVQIMLKNYEEPFRR